MYEDHQLIDVPSWFICIRLHKFWNSELFFYSISRSSHNLTIATRMLNTLTPSQPNVPFKNHCLTLQCRCRFWNWPNATFTWSTRADAPFTEIISPLEHEESKKRRHLHLSSTFCKTRLILISIWQNHVSVWLGLHPDSLTYPSKQPPLPTPRPWPAVPPQWDRESAAAPMRLLPLCSSQQKNRVCFSRFATAGNSPVSCNT